MSQWIVKNNGKKLLVFKIDGGADDGYGIRIEGSGGGGGGCIRGKQEEEKQDENQGDRDRM